MEMQMVECMKLPKELIPECKEAMACPLEQVLRVLRLQIEMEESNRWAPILAQESEHERPRGGAAMPGTCTVCKEANRTSR